jgi:hypothetical protein
VKGTDTEYSCGLMELNTKEVGRAEKQMEKVSSRMLMETSMKETGRMTRPVGSVSIRTTTGQNMRANGLMIISTVAAARAGLTAAATMDSILRERSMETVNTYGGMEAITKEPGEITRSLVLACIYGQMAAGILENG